MLSIRCFARATSRSIFRTSPCPHLRSISTISRPSTLRHPLRTPQRQPTFAFSTSFARKEPSGQYDTELAAKLAQEMSLEEDSRDSKQLPPSVQEFLDNSAFKIKDLPGNEEVRLSRTFGNESITVKFTVVDMDYDQDPDQNEVENALDDEEMYDDDTSGQRGGAQSKGTINQGRTSGGNINVAAEDSVAPADRPELADQDDSASGDQSQSPAYATTLNVTISKPGKGAMEIVTTAQDSVITIDNVYYFPNATMAEPETAEMDFARASVYDGPPFQNLDPELQTMLERYLDERGINEQLASFVPDYIEYKEQREYVQWLQNMRGFVEA